MEVEKLFAGIAVIIDNEVAKEESLIYKIRTTIANNNIPIVAYEDIPPKEIVTSLKNASFIILDWDFLDFPTSGDADEALGYVGASELRMQKQEELIEFIRLLLDELFVPVFIFSGKPISEIEEVLCEENLYSKDKPNRIFVKSKTEVESETQLFGCMEEWLKEMPSIYAMKEWDSVFQTTKIAMFKEWYRYAPRWVSVIWEMLAKDSADVQGDFGNFLTRNVVNRIQEFHFEEELFAMNGKGSVEELRKVMEKEHYIEYSGHEPEQAYTGDLFKDGETYYLNIRAQCDLSRKKDKVTLYLIKGKELSAQDIVTEDILLMSEGELRFPRKVYTLEKLQEICKNASDEKEGTTEELEEVNDQFRQYRNLLFFGQGEILEKKPEVILACVDNGKTLKFRMDLITKKFKEMKDKRIGRILPPYITRVQQKCSQYIVREGTMPIPKEIFKGFDE